jgi:phosphoribosylaminoimidazolecarboxamide formyltransferase / IMP cyclohydrolase
MDSPKIKRALISVSNKLGIVDFAKGLSDLGIEIYSTGGTRRHLELHQLPVTDLADYTQFPEIMGGRVKTLHPKIFAGILWRRNEPEDQVILRDHQISTFELVVINLYPFKSTISRPGVLIHEAIEQSDIGGPSLLRAAAKNSEMVTVVCDPSQYSSVLNAIQREGTTSSAMRRKLMAQAFQHTADYDRTIADYLSEQEEGETFPPVLQFHLNRKCELRYGENEHQAAALYSSQDCRDANLVNARQLNGKQLSFNNLLDLDSALAIVRAQPDSACAVIKHNNPCGAAVGVDLTEACRKALAGDPQSAFGGVLGVNRELDSKTAEFLAGGEFFIEAIVAPGFQPDALKILTSVPKWKKNVRLIKVGELAPARADWDLKRIYGGLLVQEADTTLDDPDHWRIVTTERPSSELMSELEFGWQLVRHVKSNAITLSKEKALVGVGAGQMSRVDSVEIAIRKAGSRTKGSVLASDAFFPFPDSIEAASRAGIAAIIQPGGSVNDQLAIDCCNQAGIPMVFTGKRHFRH